MLAPLERETGAYNHIIHMPALDDQSMVSELYHNVLVDPWTHRSDTAACITLAAPTLDQLCPDTTSAVQSSVDKPVMWKRYARYIAEQDQTKCRSDA